MINSIKERLYFLKVWWKICYSYPQQTLIGKGGVYEEYWKNKRGTNMSGLSPWQKDRVRLIEACLKGSPIGKVNDIGSGPGAVLKEIRDTIPGFVGGIGYDVAESATHSLKAEGFGAVVCDVRDTKNIEMIAEADHGLLFEVIEHVPRSEDLLLEVFRKSRVGVFVSIPNSGFFIYRLRLFVFGKFPMQWTVYPDEHLRFWTKADLSWWLRALGLRKFKIIGYRGVPFLNKVWPALFAAGLFAHIEK